MKITVAGAGYVGFSTGALLSYKNDVIIYDILEKKVNIINEGKCPINDKLLSKLISDGEINLKATTESEKAFANAEIVIIATNTNPNKNGKLNLDSVIECAELAFKYNKNAILVIRSTVPVGFTDSLGSKLNKTKLVFCPEFLRENSAFKDNLYPDRIIAGGQKKYAELFIDLLSKSCKKLNIEKFICGIKEAEAVKLFSNSYLAMRISFFNELSTIGQNNSLNVKEIIKGVCLDQRIGDFYNQPSFAFAGHCLEKDTRQLLSLSKSPNQSLFDSVLKCNEDRLDHFLNKVKERNPSRVGLYKISSNGREDSIKYSASNKLLLRLLDYEFSISIFDPSISDNNEIHRKRNVSILSSLEEFLSTCDLILAEKIDNNIFPVRDKIITPDISIYE